MTRLHKLIEAQLRSGERIENCVKPCGAHYIISPEVLAALVRSDAAKAIASVVESGIARLPHPEVLIEFESAEGYTRFVWIKEDVFSFHCSTALIKGERASVSIDPISVHFKDGQLRVSKSEGSSAEAVGVGVSMALLLLNLKGLERRVVEYGRLNKQRIAKGKVAIPTASILHIGTVYTRGGSAVDTGKGNTRLKLCYIRAGHTRSQAYGKGRVQHKLIYIEPTIVNYDPDGETTPKVKQKLIKL